MKLELLRRLIREEIEAVIGEATEDDAKRREDHLQGIKPHPKMSSKEFASKNPSKKRPITLAHHAYVKKHGLAAWKEKYGK